MQRQITIFVDRSLGRHIVAQALREAGAIVEIHDDHFPQDCPDQTWLTDVAGREWVVVAKDGRIGYRRVEQLAVANAGARVFLLVGGNLTGGAMGEAFARALPGMYHHVEASPAPFIAKVYRTGKVAIWKDAESLLGSAES